MSSSDDFQVIGFKTQGTWYPSDVVLLSESVLTIYNTFLSKRKFLEFREKSIDQYIKNLHLFEKYAFDFSLSKRYSDIYRRWLDLYREYLEESRKLSTEFGIIPNFLPPPFPFPIQQLQPIESKVTVLEIYQDLERYSYIDNNLRIHKIKMSSPGFFSFAGVGEVIKEIRELIKDLWYRNKQENVKGRLEIIDKYLDIKARYQNSNDFNFGPIKSEKELLENVDKGMNEIKKLEENQKLKDVPENIEYVEED